MIGSRHTTSKVITPSASTDGEVRGRKLFLKAANDNRMPLNQRLSKALFYLAPITAGLFFVAIWYFG